MGLCYHGFSETPGTTESCDVCTEIRTLKLQNNELRTFILKDSPKCPGDNPCSCVRCRFSLKPKDEGLQLGESRNLPYPKPISDDEAKRRKCVCDSCGWNNGPNCGAGSRVMYTVGKVTKCGSCLPTSR